MTSAISTIILWPCLWIFNWMCFVFGIAAIYFSISRSLPLIFFILALYIALISLPLNIAAIGVLTRHYYEFAIFIGIAIILHTCVFVYVIFSQNYIKNEILNTFEEINISNITNPGDDFHKYQKTRRCCGIESYDDWLNFTGRIPGSCCNKDFKQNCTMETLPRNIPGCKSKQLSMINNGFFVFLGLTWLIIVVGIILVIIVFVTKHYIVLHDDNSIASDETTE